MRKILTILLLIVTIRSQSQFVTQRYFDSAFATLDSTIVKPVKVTSGSQTITIDTLTINNNTTRTYQLLLETNFDVAEKVIQLSNVSNTYTIVSNKDVLTLSKQFLSRTPNWDVLIRNNKVVVEVSGDKNKTITWRLSKTIL